MRPLHRAILAFIGLSVICLTCVQCKSKQKTTERYKNTTEFHRDNSLKETVKNNLVKDSVATRKTFTDWSSIIESIDLSPINPSKPAQVEIGTTGNGNLIIKSQNANVSKKTQQEQKKETTQDSTGTKEVDQSKRETDINQTGSGQTLESGRNSNSETEGMSGWVSLGIGLALFVLLILVIFKVYLNRV